MQNWERRAVMAELFEIIEREFIYLWYYFDLQLRQIFPLLGARYGSRVADFGLCEGTHP